MRVHFVGCEGVSMRRLMELTAKLGHTVSGSDNSIARHNASNVEGANLVVFSGAVSSDNPELVYAYEHNIPLCERGKFLGAIASGFREVVAVAGTHGKTTVTALTANVLSQKNPTIHIGADFPYNDFDCNNANNDIFVTEACEYRRSLLEIRPTLAVILNAELDHTDCYNSIDEIADIFVEFAQKSNIALYYGDDTILQKRMPISAYTFGEGERNDFRAIFCAPTNDNCYPFYFYVSGIRLGKVTPRLRGKHNAINILASLSIGILMGIPFSDLVNTVNNFNGVKRRLEFVGKAFGAKVYTDYAHHPTEIIATLKALQTRNKLIAVFEPHTFSRTNDLFYDFVHSLSLANEVILAPIYASREKSGNISSLDLCKCVHKLVPTRFFDTYEHINNYLSNTLRPNDTVVFLGAGSIDGCARMLVNMQN